MVQTLITREARMWQANYPVAKNLRAEVQNMISDGYTIVFASSSSITKASHIRSIQLCSFQQITLLVVML
jgi:hypothetical protein